MTITRAMIHIAANGGESDAYLAAPKMSTGPGAVMVSSIFGVDQELKDRCDALAERGCVALAQNFFWRDADPGVLSLPADLQRAIARVMRVDFAKAMDDLGRGIATLRGHANCNGRIAVFGFCFGGPFAWRAACGFGIDAAVSFHGTHVSKSMRPGDKPTCPMSFHYGDQDEYAPPAEIEAVRKVAEATHSEFVVHPGAGHGYMMRTDGRHYHAEAARKSWDRALQMIDALRT